MRRCVQQVSASETTELSRDNKTQTEPITEGTSLTVDDDISEGTMPTGTVNSAEDEKHE